MNGFEFASEALSIKGYELDKILEMRSQLPELWQDPDVLFWDCHLEEVAGDIVTHLMEVDWLPEAAKPVLRQAYLSITLYAEHIQREVKREESRMSDVRNSLQETMQRVSAQKEAKLRTRKMNRLLKIRQTKEKKERDAQSCEHLRCETDVRLLFFNMQDQQRLVQKKEEELINIAQGELEVLKEVFADALKKQGEVLAELHKAHIQLKFNNPNNKSANNGRPNTRGGDGSNSNGRPRRLAPLQQQRPGTAPSNSKRKQNNGTKSRSNVSLVDVANLYILVTEAMKNIDKYIHEIVTMVQRKKDERVRMQQKRGESLKSRSQKRLNLKAKKRRSRKPKLFSGDLEKLISKQIKKVKRKKFH